MGDAYDDMHYSAPAAADHPEFWRNRYEVAVRERDAAIARAEQADHVQHLTEQELNAETAEAIKLRRQLDSLLKACGSPALLRLDADTLWDHSHRDAGLNPQLRVLGRIADAVDALAAVGDPEEGR